MLAEDRSEGVVETKPRQDFLFKWKKSSRIAVSPLLPTRPRAPSLVESEASIDTRQLKMRNRKFIRHFLPEQSQKHGFLFTLKYY